MNSGRSWRANARRNAAGYTLIEVIVTVTLLTAALSGFYMFLLSQSRVASEEFRENDGQTKMVRTLDMILPMLQDARIASKDTLWSARVCITNDTLLFQVPQKALNGTPATNYNSATFQLNLIYGSQAGPVFYTGGYHRLIFRPSVIEPPIVEATVQRSAGAGVDLNGDGDTNDSLLWGQLELETYDNAGVQIGQALPMGGVFCVVGAGAVQVSPVFKSSMGNGVDVRMIYPIIQTPNGEFSRVKLTQTSFAWRN